MVATPAMPSARTWCRRMNRPIRSSGRPGSSQISGTYSGAPAVGGLLGNTMTLSEGTLRLAATGAPMVNGNLCAFPIHFSGKRSNGADMSMDGVDVLRVEGEKIAEVWLFSSVQADEDAFWGAS